MFAWYAKRQARFSRLALDLPLVFTQKWGDSYVFLYSGFQAVHRKKNGSSIKDHKNGTFLSFLGNK